MSLAEETLAAQLSQAGIPYSREFLFARSLGRKWRSDFALLSKSEWYLIDAFELSMDKDGPDYLVEIEGGAYMAGGGRHTRGPGFEADLEKYNTASILGYKLLRFTPSMVEDGRALSVVRAALGLAEQAA